jgi:hypothetical protein
LNPDLAALDFANSHGHKIKKECQISFGFNGDHFIVHQGSAILENILQVGCFASPTRAVEDNFAFNLSFF